jgi:hypothetical protein
MKVYYKTMFCELCYNLCMKIKFNKVTSYSKVIALALFVGLPFLFFWLGVWYGETKQHTADVLANLKNQTAASASQTTQVVRYAPPAPTNSMQIVSGSCFTNSIAAPYRPDAWRCTVGNETQDPCFQVGTSSSLICGVHPEDATNASAFVLTLTEPLPVAEIPPNPPPDWAWQVKLNDGTICTPFTGTLPFSADGKVAKYSCNSADGRMIFGDLDASPTVWTALVGTLSKSATSFPPPLESSATVPVAVVWQ